MSNYSIKYRHIFPTFLWVTLGFVLILSAARYFLAIRSEIVHFKLEVWEIVFPVFLPWIPILIWLRPRLRILYFKDEDSNRGRNQLMFHSVTWATVLATAMISQSYMTSATGSLQHLSTLSDAHTSKLSHYYQIQNFAIRRDYESSYSQMKTSGRRNQTLTITFYFVWPMVDSNSSDHKYWYGLKFEEQMSSRLGAEQEQERYRLFHARCLWDLSNYNFHAVEYFERLPNGAERDQFLKAVEAAKGSHINPEIFVPKKETFEARNGNKLVWVFGSYAMGTGVFILLLTWPGYSTLELEKQLKKKRKPRRVVI